MLPPYFGSGQVVIESKFPARIVVPAPMLPSASMRLIVSTATVALDNETHRLTMIADAMRSTQVNATNATLLVISLPHAPPAAATAAFVELGVEPVE